MSACAGAFTLACHVEESVAFRTAILGEENLKVKILYPDSIVFHVFQDTVDLLKQGI